ncbi:NIM1-interacting protein [Parasponia andersonii]|uniref:NIM1-interacting protein n=1 Tax=Parasponia andersonii TaxID=3476 RepID=A0A2P5D8N3_PARAD|nr:NIM1-interacting protein [Parasponia andersonii]
MERDGKKRIIATEEKEEEEEEVKQDHDDGDEEEEEEKIEKFFAIIKSLREARTWITNCLNEFEVSNKDAKKLRVHGPAWTPVFELEDFAGPEKDDNAGTSYRFSMKKAIGVGKEKEREEKGLDLNLTL